jgi:hypothetical protein
MTKKKLEQKLDKLTFSELSKLNRILYSKKKSTGKYVPTIDSQPVKLDRV